MPNVMPPKPPASIYEVSPVVDGSLIAGSFAASLATTLDAAHFVKRRCPCSPDIVNPIDRSVIGHHSDTADLASTALAAVAVTVPAAIDAAVLGWNSTLFQDLTVYTEVLAVNSLAVTAAKYSVQRPRPRTYARDPDFVNSENGYVSFYSGHTSTTVAALSMAAYTAVERYELGPWPWVTAGIVGATVGALRIEAGQHFYSDVAAGALAGAVFGISVPLLHRRDHAEAADLALIEANDGLELIWRREL